MQEISIIGAGLAGCLLALMLAKRNYKITIYESRPDFRQLSIDFGRSINLALSKRGITGLEQVGLMAKVKPLLVPMRARAIHSKEGDVSYQAFGRHADEYINSIRRSDLLKLLLSEVDTDDNIRVYFDHELQYVDFNRKKISFITRSSNTVEKNYHRLIGADGVGSKVRNCLKQMGYIDASRIFLPHSYKELTIAKKNSHSLTKEHLHLWARERFLLLGNPNADTSITGTIFMENKGESSFQSINSEEKIEGFFQRNFTDVSDYMNDLKEEFINNPIGRLSTVKASSWFYQDSCLLLGDAAHAIVPFFGQGMNSAFEDCRVLNNLLQQNHDDWEQTIKQFYQARKPNTDAIASMSMDNYHEIESQICDEKFNLKKQLEQELMQRYPERYLSKHVMVMFTNLPYAYAKACGVIQQQLLSEIGNEIESLESVNWGVVDEKLTLYDKNLTKIAAKFELV